MVPLPLIYDYGRHDIPTTFSLRLATPSLVLFLTSPPLNQASITDPTAASIYQNGKSTVTSIDDIPRPTTNVELWHCQQEPIFTHSLRGSSSDLACIPLFKWVGRLTSSGVSVIRAQSLLLSTFFISRYVHASHILRFN